MVGDSFKVVTPLGDVEFKTLEEAKSFAEYFSAQENKPIRIVNHSGGYEVSDGWVYKGEIFDSLKDAEDAAQEL